MSIQFWKNRSIVVATLAIILVLANLVSAQPRAINGKNSGMGVTQVSAIPTGACVQGMTSRQVPVGSGGAIYDCVANSWTVRGGGGGSGVTSLTGTAGQVNVSASTGNITLSLPQSISVSSSVQFGTLALIKEWGSSSTSNLMTNIKSYGDAIRIIYTHAGGTAASPTQTPAGQNIFNFQAKGTDNTGAESNGSRASINFVANEAFTASGQGTYILFNTTQNSTASQSARMKIDHDGRILINNLIGAGTRMVAVGANGYLEAQAIPSGITPRTYSGAYSIFPKNSTGDSSGSYTANTVYFYKASEPDAITINRIGTYVFTGSAGATVDIGFYTSNCATKLISTGATDVTSSSTSLAVTVASTTISGGVCVMWTTSSATPTFQQLTWAANAWRFANSNGATSILGTCSNTASGGALPASCGTLTNSNTLAPIAVRAWVN